MTADTSLATVRVAPATKLSGELVAPPDKSITHRAFLFAALSNQRVAIENPLLAADTKSTLRAVELLGANVQERSAREIWIEGVGLRGPKRLQVPIDVGNAGTLLRILPGWLAGQPGMSWVLDGDSSIRKRPVDRIIEPLAKMGGDLRAREGKFSPLEVHGAALHGCEYHMPVASAQVKSAVLLAALFAEGQTTVYESSFTRDHTERILACCGADIQRHGLALTASRAETITLTSLNVPGDLSSAAFFLVAALLVPQSHLLIRNVSTNWGRTGLLRVIERMGGEVVVHGTLEDQPGDVIPTDEPVADLEVRFSPGLQPVEVSGDEIPALIDELPLVALLGAHADGVTVVRDAKELRMKESDRVATTVAALRPLGVAIEPTSDGFIVDGTRSCLNGGQVESYGDHRIAMLGAVAGLCSQSGVEISGAAAVSVSYSTFFRDLAKLAN